METADARMKVANWEMRPASDAVVEGRLVSRT